MNDKSRRAPPLAGQLKPPAGRQIDAPHLADGGGDAGGAQGVFQGGKSLGLVPDLNLDQAVGGKAQPSQARRIEIAPAHHPDHRPSPGQRRGQGGGEGARRGGGFDLQPLAPYRVPAAQGQAAGGKRPIQPHIAEGQDSPGRRAASLQDGDAGPHCFEARRAGHGIKTPFVLFLF